MESAGEIPILYLCSVKRVDTDLPEKEVSLTQVTTYNPKKASKLLIQDVFRELSDDSDEEERANLCIIKKLLDVKIDTIIGKYMKDGTKTHRIVYGAPITSGDGDERTYEYDAYYGDIVLLLYHDGLISYVLEIYKIELDKPIHICIYEH